MDLRESLGRRLLLLDGATGTQLQARGLQPGQTPELWNIQRREDMTAIHRSYYEAGPTWCCPTPLGPTASS